MAKFGEGDPRWLVEERADGTNVNNWHWVEKDCIDWARSRLEQLFKDTVLLNDPEAATCSTSGIDSVKGEAFLNVRKAKLIPSYELDVKVKWAGSIQSQTATGKIHFPYIADENHDEEPEVKIICDSDDPTSSKLKDALLKTAKQFLISKMQTFVSELRSGVPAQSAAPEPASASASQTASTTAAKPKLTSAEKDKVAANGAIKLGACKRTRTISLQEKFYARPSDIFECFVVEGRLRAFTRSDCSADAKAGGKFSWYNGSVSGEFVELQAPSKLVLKWRFNTWEDDCFSLVTLTLEEPDGPGSTVLHLHQTQIPEADKFGNEDVLEQVENGWKGQVFQRIKQIFGYGV